MSQVVIIPTTGAPTLQRAVLSVLAQQEPTQCYVVCDGEAHVHKVHPQLQGLPVALCVLPLNTGASNDRTGHRIYAAFAHLVDQDHVLFLDEDNWFEPDHVGRCLALMRQGALQWCYTLRNICTPEGDYICRDDCESLGGWPAHTGARLIDTNCWFMRRELLVRVCQVWHGPWHIDRVFTQAMMQSFPQFACTGHYTVNYCLSPRPRGGTREFFETGNALMHQQHGPHPPWRAADCPGDDQATITSVPDAAASRPSSGAAR
jgi:Glycosyl transferase family 2